MTKTVHIIGAGVSGLSAAIKLANAGYRIEVHEATTTAGGRCRSYYDAATDLVIDNGNHLLLSGNHHARAYARSIGTEAGLEGPAQAEFPFMDLKSGKKWLLQLGNGRLPTWVFDKNRRVPDTTLMDYIKLAPLAWSPVLVSSAMRSRARARSITASCSRCCWPRSMSIRRSARPGLPVLSFAKRCSRAGKPVVR